MIRYFCDLCDKEAPKSCAHPKGNLRPLYVGGTRIPSVCPDCIQKVEQFIHDLKKEKEEAK